MKTVKVNKIKVVYQKEKEIPFFIFLLPNLLIIY